MAEIPLRLISWVYDDETNRVEAKFEDAPVEGNPDPASHRSTKFFTIELLPQSVEAEERELEMPPTEEPPPYSAEPTEVPTPPVPPVEE